MLWKQINRIIFLFKNTRDILNIEKTTIYRENLYN
nr:MAG TPA: hypothetical protein [Caudoviricetes sp.]DAV74923.1 MAG TPA: hypothetical protein [Caudoviricetes sp.]